MKAAQIPALRAPCESLCVTNCTCGSALDSFNTCNSSDICSAVWWLRGGEEDEGPLVSSKNKKTFVKRSVILEIMWEYWAYQAPPHWFCFCKGDQSESSLLTKLQTKWCTVWQHKPTIRLKLVIHHRVTEVLISIKYQIHILMRKCRIPLGNDYDGRYCIAIKSEKWHHLHLDWLLLNLNFTLLFMLPLGSHLVSTVFTTAEPTIPACAYNQLTSLFQVAGAEKTRQRPPLINFYQHRFKKNEWKRQNKIQDMCKVCHFSSGIWERLVVLSYFNSSH